MIWRGSMKLGRFQKVCEWFPEAKIRVVGGKHWMIGFVRSQDRAQVNRGNDES